MSMLQGFEVVESINGILTMSVTKNGIAFNKTVLDKLGCPEKVVALINKETKCFAIQPCDESNQGARDFYNKNRRTSYGVRWNNQDLRSTIETIMDWNVQQQGWRIKGVYSEDDNAVVFDLNKAEEVTSRSSSKKGGFGHDEDIPF